MSLDIERLKKSADHLERKLREIPALRKAQKTIGIPITYALAGVLALTLILIYVFSGARAITNLVAFVYPAYMTMKALNTDNKEDDELWLAYWLFYGFFSLIESITDLFLFWVPMYELFKMIFIIYLYAPQMKGAIVLYTKLLQPWVKKMEKYERKVVGTAQTVFNEASAANKTNTAQGSNMRKSQ